MTVRLPSPPSPLSRLRGRGGATVAGLRTVAVVASVVLLLLVTATAARADGEVGLVIEENGQVRTFCVAYTGASISGTDLLAAAGIPHEDLRTSSGSVLCAINNTGCFDAGSFNDCWCQCSGGGSNCVYWAFFTRDHGSGWVYSSRAFDRTTSNDGDLHAWKWGQGGPSSAPKPSDSLTFESVCGHAPRGGVAPQPATPTSASTTAPAPTTGTTPPSATSDAAPATLSPGPSSLTPQVSVTFTASPGPAATPLAPLTRDGDDADGGGPAGLVAFAVIAAILVAGIAAAAYWRRHGGH